ncbi:metallophosphoesterase [bacterium]|nr:metallophosphoesterase [bacterium]
MNIFALSDLHLSFTQNKAMDIFGEKWHLHWQKIAENWRRTVKDEDIVLVAGDISWAMRPPEAQEDLLWLEKLPGHKVLIRGNHDYWWQSIGKIRSAYPQLNFIQNDVISFGSISICGSRGWAQPGSPEYTEEDIKIYKRELLRLEMGLQKLDPQAELRVAMLHYPPFGSISNKSSEFIDLLKKYKVDACIFGHLHNLTGPGMSFSNDGINYYLTSADYLNFSPVLIWNGENLTETELV